MPRISKSINALNEHYDVVVIGSGYGGGIAASRLSRAGRQVCVLERGREFQPGEFPDNLPEASAEMQFRTKKGRVGNDTGLFEFHVNDDINVLVGCGLGGTSLINANVLIEADARVFDNPVWPKGLTEDLNNGVAKGYKRARTMLGANPYPEGEPHYPELLKTRAMKQAARAANGEFGLPDLAVTFKKTPDDRNHVGVEQTPCIKCGDCCSGCNHTSKNTVQMNYLPDAYNHGADIFTEINARRLERQDGKWLVHFEAVGTGRKRFSAANPFVSADIVVLGAGTLGTTEILLRFEATGTQSLEETWRTLYRQRRCARVRLQQRPGNRRHRLGRSTSRPRPAGRSHNYKRDRYARDIEEIRRGHDHRRGRHSRSPVTRSGYLPRHSVKSHRPGHRPRIS